MATPSDNPFPGSLVSTQETEQLLSPISLLSKRCAALYQTLLEALQTTTEQEATEREFQRHAALLTTQDSRSRFKAWGNSIAAFQDVRLKSSLDSRLLDANDIRKRILKILENLQESLDDALLIVIGVEANETWGALSDSEEEDVDHNDQKELAQETTELDQLFMAMQTANSNLMKLSIVIRNSPSRDDYLKAAKRYRYDPQFDIGHVREKHPASQNNAWLIERLGKAISRRRAFLKYRQEHHEKLSKNWEEIPDEVDRKKPETIAISKHTKATTFIFENKPAPQKEISEPGSVGSQTSYEQTIMGETSETKLAVPPPPIEAFEGVEFIYGEPFQCPLCFTEQTVKNRAAWKRHVFHDLKPYVCTFNCTLKMFKSRNEWFTHELQCHRREWTCHICQKACSQKNMLSSHLTSEHQTGLTGSDLEALVLQSEEPVDRISASACLICDEWRATLEDPKKEAKRLFLNDGKTVKPYGTLNAFRRHLGRHMEQLALFALPKGDNPDEMEDDSADSADDSEEDALAPNGHCQFINECEERCLPGFIYCWQHGCEYLNCRNFRMSGPMCEIHRGVLGDFEEEEQFPGTDTHIDPAIQEHVLESQSTNDNHAWAYCEEASCMQFTMPPQLYCDSHQCEIPGCALSRERGNILCTDHFMLQTPSSEQHPKDDPSKQFSQHVDDAITFTTPASRIRINFNLVKTWLHMNEQVLEIIAKDAKIGAPPRKYDLRLVTEGGDNSIPLNPVLWQAKARPGWQVEISLLKREDSYDGLSSRKGANDGAEVRSKSGLDDDSPREEIVASLPESQSATTTTGQHDEVSATQKAIEQEPSVAESLQRGTVDNPIAAEIRIDMTENSSNPQWRENTPGKHVSSSPNSREDSLVPKSTLIDELDEIRSHYYKLVENKHIRLLGPSKVPEMEEFEVDAMAAELFKVLVELDSVETAFHSKERVHKDALVGEVTAMMEVLAAEKDPNSLQEERRANPRTSPGWGKQILETEETVTGTSDSTKTPSLFPIIPARSHNSTETWWICGRCGAGVFVFVDYLGTTKCPGCEHEYCGEEAHCSTGPFPEEYLDVDSILQARQAEITRRCASLDPPLEIDLLRNLSYFKDAMQIPRPLGEKEWAALLPRLLSQQKEATLSKIVESGKRGEEHVGESVGEEHQKREDSSGSLVRTYASDDLYSSNNKKDIQRPRSISPVPRQPPGDALLPTDQSDLYLGGQTRPQIQQQKQRPQSGKAKMMEQQILQALDSQPTEHLTGWQPHSSLKDRLAIILPIIGNLRLAAQTQANLPNLQEMVQTAIELEHRVFEKSVSEAAYKAELDGELAQILVPRNEIQAGLQREFERKALQERESDQLRMENEKKERDTIQQANQVAATQRQPKLSRKQQMIQDAQAQQTTGIPNQHQGQHTHPESFSESSVQVNARNPPQNDPVNNYWGSTPVSLMGYIENDFPCEYSTCTRIYKKKQSYQDHLIDSHKEDICAPKKPALLQRWQQDRRIKSGTWRCSRCLMDNMSFSGWTCGNTKCCAPIEAERKLARLKLIEKEDQRILSQFRPYSDSAHTGASEDKYRDVSSEKGEVPDDSSSVEREGIDSRTHRTKGSLAEQAKANETAQVSTAFSGKATSPETFKRFQIEVERNRKGNALSENKTQDLVRKTQELKSEQDLVTPISADNMEATDILGTLDQTPPSVNLRAKGPILGQLNQLSDQEDEDETETVTTFEPLRPLQTQRRSAADESADRIVTAIDYWTTYTGVAFAVPRSDSANLNSIQNIQNWGSDGGDATQQPSSAGLSPEALAYPVKASKSRGITASTSFTISQYWVGAPLKFSPPAGSRELEELIDAFIPSSSSKEDKMSEVTNDFYKNATVDLDTGGLTRHYNVFPSTAEQTSVNSRKGKEREKPLVEHSSLPSGEFNVLSQSARPSQTPDNIYILDKEQRASKDRTEAAKFRQEQRENANMHRVSGSISSMISSDPAIGITHSPGDFGQLLNIRTEQAHEAENNDIPHIKRILGHRFGKGIRFDENLGIDDFEYLIRWQNKTSPNTWETTDSLVGALGIGILANHFRDIVPKSLPSLRSAWSPSQRRMEDSDADRGERERTERFEEIRTTGSKSKAEKKASNDARDSKGKLLLNQSASVNPLHTAYFVYEDGDMNLDEPRGRTRVKYDDGLTEEQCLMAVDDDEDSPEAAAARKAARKDREEKKRNSRGMGFADNSAGSSEDSEPDPDLTIKKGKDRA